MKPVKHDIDKDVTCNLSLQVRVSLRYNRTIL